MPTPCKPAPACRKALADATQKWPARNRASDGICGDQKHAARASDHNPDASGFAHAFDLTHDPAHGVDCDMLAVTVIYDPRVKYVIWEGKIWKARTRGWDVYRGPNPHNHHIHVSINPNATHNLDPWPWSPTVGKRLDKPLNLPLLKLEIPMMKGEQVTLLQRRLVFHGIDITPDSVFGYATSKGVRLFQEKKKLPADGTVGSRTWTELLADK